MRKQLAAFWFSGTGNTKAVTERLCELLQEKYETTTHDITRGEYNEELTKADTIVLAFPVYGSCPPRPMRAFVRAHGEMLRGKEVIVIATQYMFSGDGAASLGRTAEKYGAHVRYAEHFCMPNNISDCKIFAVRNGDALIPMLKKTQKRMERFARRILEEKPFRRGFGAVSHAVGYLGQRALFRKHESEKGKLLCVDSALCTGCGACVRACPVQNLLLTDGKATGMGKCALCYKCVNLCPNKAIKLFGKRPPAEQYRGLPHKKR